MHQGYSVDGIQRERRDRPQSVPSFENGGGEAVASFGHEDVEMSQLPGWPGMPPYRGLEAALRSMSEWTSSFEGFRSATEQFTAAAGSDRAVVAAREWGKPRGGNVEAEERA